MPAGEAAITQGGERRHLTVLFCDLVGSTALAELLDPEEVGELLLAYQEMGREAIVELGGQVAQYLGDGLLAFFGYPVAHEDDAERAVRAGMAIIDGLDALNERFGAPSHVRLEARVGIHSGPAIVGAMGSADRSDTSLFGSTPNIASRLETAADPGVLLVSDATRRQLGLGVRLTDRGLFALKGVSQPVQVWQVDAVEGVAPRLRRMATVPMVGRLAEMETLRRRLELAEAGAGQVVVVSGEPGVGKSRLVRALEDQATAAHHVWIELQCAELSSGTPLAPVRDLLERVVGLPDAPAAERRARLSSLLEPLGPRVIGLAPYVAELLGFGDPRTLATEGRELRRRRALEALAEWTVALAADRTVVVVAEDVHWCDPTSFELLSLVAARSAGQHLLCLVTKRPDRTVALPGDVTAIDLPRLDNREAHELVDLLGAALDADGRAAVIDRGDGIPLFIEELTRSATDAGGSVAEESLPDTLQGVLSARLDRLGGARIVAQAAAVLGRWFSVPLLAAVSTVSAGELDASLDQLCEAGLLDTREGPRHREGRFRHALIQQAAYSSLLRRQRHDLHRRVVDALRGQFADVPVSRPELMAHHLAGAGEPGAAAAWYERAGRRAAERASFDEAVAHYQRGLELLDGSVPEPERGQQELSLHILRANALMGSSGLGGAELLPIWLRAIELAEQLGDRDELSSALNGAAVYYADHGEGDLTVQTCERILSIAAESGSRVAALRGNGTLGMHRFFSGEGDAALEHFEHAIKLSRRGDFELVTYGVGHDENVFFHTMSSWVLWWTGRPDAGLARALAGSRRAATLPSSLSQAMAGHSVAMAHHLRGERASAMRAASTNLRLTEEVGLPFWQGLARLVLGAEQARDGDEGGLAQMERGFELLASIGSQGGSTFALAMLAEAQLHLGQYEAVVASADAGLEMSAQIRQPFYDPELLRLRAVALVNGPARRRFEGASLLDDSWALARRMGAASWALRTAITAVRLVGREVGIPLLQNAIAAMGDGHTTIEQREAHGLLAGFDAERSPVDLPLTSEERP